MTATELRQNVRRVYDFACGYCGVREEDAGSELELDHFKPRSLGARHLTVISEFRLKLRSVSYSFYLNSNHILQRSTRTNQRRIKKAD
jgi:5-methylcytosine-specific restriction endonuclease McrA